MYRTMDSSRIRSPVVRTECRPEFTSGPLILPIRSWLRNPRNQPETRSHDHVPANTLARASFVFMPSRTSQRTRKEDYRFLQARGLRLMHHFWLRFRLSIGLILVTPYPVTRNLTAVQSQSCLQARCRLRTWSIPGIQNPHGRTVNYLITNGQRVMFMPCKRCHHSGNRLPFSATLVSPCSATGWLAVGAG